MQTLGHFLRKFYFFEATDPIVILYPTGKNLPLKM